MYNKYKLFNKSKENHFTSSSSILPYRGGVGGWGGGIIILAF